jgi:hypothetical protein
MDRKRRQLTAAILIAVSIGMTAYIWHTALTEGSFMMKGSIFFPLGAVVGVGYIFLPPPQEERKARGEDIAQLSNWQIITPRWWAILIVGLLAGCANYYMLSSGSFLS